MLEFASLTSKILRIYKLAFTIYSFAMSNVNYKKHKHNLFSPHKSPSKISNNPNLKMLYNFGDNDMNLKELILKFETWFPCLSHFLK